MVRDIVKLNDDGGREILSTPCSKVTMKEASSIVKDLLDTVKYYDELSEKGEFEKTCYGLAANQIGINKAVFVYKTSDGKWYHMINPIIVSKSKETIDSDEGCMSMEGTSTVTRHKKIQVFYKRMGSNRTYTLDASGFTATVIQHEIDHLHGILI